MNRQREESDDSYETEENYILTINEIVIVDQRMRG